jgi:hypothetical protein
MYTNIDSTIGLTAIKDFLDMNKNYISQDFPKELFLQILQLVMENNIFSFSNTYWLQLTGTAMGTPVACAYATVTFGQYENSTIPPKYHHQLLYYKRYIDDIIGIWVPNNDNNSTSWYDFKNDLNNWGSLQWKIEEPSRKKVFLDLEITLQDNTVTTRTYQKDMNLYLYIPPLSAHPPSCFKGLITSEVRRYWLQNNPENFQKILINFIERLVERGHSLTDISPLLHRAAASMDSHICTSKNRTSDNVLFIHRTYHPNGLQCKDIRQLYQKILKPHLDFDKMIVAVSRPRNLRDKLTRAALQAPENLNITQLIQNLSNSLSCQKPSHNH